MSFWIEKNISGFDVSMNFLPQMKVFETCNEKVILYTRIEARLRLLREKIKHVLIKIIANINIVNINKT